jgi:hypothetical protein
MVYSLDEVIKNLCQKKMKDHACAGEEFWNRADFFCGNPSTCNHPGALLTPAGLIVLPKHTMQRNTVILAASF